VFYSWQADLPSRANRAFIQDCLEGAAKAVRADESLQVDVRIDRDTADVGGSPAIAETILKKIAAAEIFVPDVSIVARTEAGKACPNPNVLLELGYAVSQLGWDRIIMVMNTAFGPITDLPFDLRGRRVMPYSVDPEAGAPKADQRRKLEAQLREALTTILGPRQARADADRRQGRDELIKQARQIRDERLKVIVGREGPAASLSSERLICIHVVPASAVSGGSLMAINELNTESTYLPPFGTTGYNTDFNGDGLLRIAAGRDGRTESYLQVFRDGILESVNSQMLIGRGRPDGLPGPAFCTVLGMLLDNVIKFMQAVKISPPVCIFLTFTGLKDTALLVEADGGYVVRRFDRDSIKLPEVVLEDFGASPDPKRLLRQPLDVLWQHAGLDGCPYFLSDGTWNRPFALRRCGTQSMMRARRHRPSLPRASSLGGGLPNASPGIAKRWCPQRELRSRRAVPGPSRLVSAGGTAGGKP
jgi:hypothetical protein